MWRPETQLNNLNKTKDRFVDLFDNRTKILTSDAFFVSTLVLANFLFRIHLFNHPISDFRETQTAFGVRSILRNGMSIFRADVPVFGPPWKLPFEFPVFQYCAAVVAQIFGFAEVKSSLITATIFFLASGVAFLYLFGLFLEAQLRESHSYFIYFQLMACILEHAYQLNL